MLWSKLLGKKTAAAEQNQEAHYLGEALSGRPHELRSSFQNSMEQVRYQALLLNGVRDAIVVWNTAGIITYWSPSAEALFEVRAADLLGQPVESCYFNAFNPPVHPPPREGTGGQEIERSCKGRDGRTIWVSSRVSALCDFGDGGRMIGFMDVSRDITARKRAEEALRESEARYRAVSEMISDFVYALQVSPEGTFTCDWITGAFQAVTGYQPNEIDWHEHWQNLIHPDDNSIAQLLALRLLFGYKDEREFRILAKSGEVRWVHHCAQPVWDQAEGRVVRIYGAVMDITERKQMEAQIQLVQTRLAQSARLAAIGELASGVAHHINNPLTTIIAESQILLQNLPKVHIARESAEAIEQAGWRVQKAVQQLLDFSRPAANTIETLSVNSTIQSALELVSGQIQSAGIQLEVELAEGLPPLRGNNRQLSDLWVNFLMLARDATSDGIPHTIRIRSKDLSNGSLAIEISDDGAPIPTEEMAVLFEPNFVKSLGGRGTGIELNICQEIVRQHSGQIWAESSPEAGTTFQVCLPVEVTVG